MKSAGSGRRGAGVAGLVLVAVNLRIAIAVVSPVLTQIQRSYGLSSVTAGLLTTDPVICFGLFALATPALIRRHGLDRLIVLTLAGLVAGMALRLAPGAPALFAGMTLVGASIGVINVALPSLVKRDFPDRVAVVTGLYVMALNAGAALAAGVTVPLEHGLATAWRPTIALWALPAAVALVVWAGVRRGGRPVAAARAPARPRWEVPALWHDRLAWAVTAFMGLQSLSYYAALAWIPTILEHAGLSASAAGAMLSISSVAAIVTSLMAPELARRTRRTALSIVVTVAACATGFAGLAADPAGPTALWMVVLGLGQGASLALALGMISLRSPDAEHTARLSMMAQSCGYLVASAGPVGLGVVHDLTRTWSVPLLVLVVLLLPELVAGVLAARPGHVLAGGTPGPPAAAPPSRAGTPGRRRRGR